MKLSDLIAFRNTLDSFGFGEVVDQSDSKINVVKHDAKTSNIDFNSIQQRIDIGQAELNQKFKEFELLIQTIKQEVQTEIDAKGQYWLAESSRMYREEMVNDSVDQILNRRYKLTSDYFQVIRSRINYFSNHRHPGMIIRPGMEGFIRDMVGFDPLYIVDEQEELLFPCTLEFSEQYRRRLRPYIVTDRDESTPILGNLPDSQFAICFAYNFFDYKPVEVINRWMSEIYQKLKPGGRLMMSINDCDTKKGVVSAETHAACYTPRSMICDYAKHIGYELYFMRNNDSASTWLEFEKPGTLTSLRGGQALAAVVDYPKNSRNT